jgi:stage III sporulation protein AE
MILVTMVDAFPGSENKAVHLASTVLIGIILLQPSNAFIKLGVDTVRQLTEYGKLLFPVLSGALAAQGATGTSAGLYALTVAFDSILSSLIANLLVPILYIYLAFAMIGAISDEKIIHKIKGSLTWCCTWGLKLILYAFLGIMSVTRIVSGATDAAAVKTVKIAISGAVPMVGSIIADASESILLSVSIMKNSAGIYGMLTVLTMFASPFLRIGIQYILMNILHWVAQLLTDHKIGKLIEDFSTVLGLLLAMIASQTVFSLISTVCFMKGVG